ncbi:DUF4229 domain-containing protein [Pimelobacter simplex]|uniref:DUF4229 domain-containing protein n=1 Tax=Nocardioides simplex TaxID=2045 RepID=A0A7J5DZ76_NOCSI|nr:DUF4229 domain-containing protein [Pimelobacter simplex]KAB2810974.1 DUF4229 domain-containing protein [Pimelobacter simplex]
MKEFWIYTALRGGLFAVTFGVVFATWSLINDSANVLMVLIIAFLVSGVASYIVLARQRNALALKVEQRAGRMTENSEARSKEDSDQG